MAEMYVAALLDGSERAESVLAAANAIALLLDLSVEAVHVREPGKPGLTGGFVRRASLRLLDGEPTERLIEVVESTQVRLAVLGSRSRGDDPRATGGVAAALVGASSKPLLVIGPHCQVPRHGRFRRALVPLDGSAAAADAAREAIELFSRSGLDVVALHVFDRQTVPAFFDQPQHEYPHFIAEFLDRHCSGPTARLTLGSGPAAPAVLAAAAAEHADMIVLSWAQNLDHDHAHVVRHALRAAEVPILLLPLPSDEGVGTGGLDTARAVRTAL